MRRNSVSKDVFFPDPRTWPRSTLSLERRTFSPSGLSRSVSRPSFHGAEKKAPGVVRQIPPKFPDRRDSAILEATDVGGWIVEQPESEDRPQSSES